MSSETNTKSAPTTTLKRTQQKTIVVCLEYETESQNRGPDPTSVEDPSPTGVRRKERGGTLNGSQVMSTQCQFLTPNEATFRSLTSSNTRLV